MFVSFQSISISIRPVSPSTIPQSDPWQLNTGSPHLHTMGQKVPDTWRAVIIAAAAIIAGTAAGAGMVLL